MRTAVALAVTIWLASACSRSNTISPGPSIAGEWAATDTTQRVMVLSFLKNSGSATLKAAMAGKPTPPR